MHLSKDSKPSGLRSVVNETHLVQIANFVSCLRLFCDFCQSNPTSILDTKLRRRRGP